MKKLILKVALFTFSSSLFFSSVYAVETNHSNHNVIKKNQTVSRQTLSETEKKELLNILKANESLHNSFYKRNYKNAEQAAKNVINAIDKVSNPQIQNKLKFTREKLAQISSSKSKKENNQNYHLISMALMHLINTYDLGSTYNGYYCPMEKKKWIQNSKKHMMVQNPFASDTMPACGTMVTHY